MHIIVLSVSLLLDWLLIGAWLLLLVVLLLIDTWLLLHLEAAWCLLLLNVHRHESCLWVVRFVKQRLLVVMDMLLFLLVCETDAEADTAADD